MRTILPIIIYLLVALPIFAIDTLVVGDDFSKANIENFASLYIQKHAGSDIENIKKLPDSEFLPLTETGVSFAAAAQLYWIKFHLKNKSPEKKKMILAVTNQSVNRLQLFIDKNGITEKSMLTGDNFPFSHRPKHHRYFLFDFEIEANKTATGYVYFDKYTEDTTIEGILYSDAGFKKADKIDTIISGSFISFMLLTCFIALFMAVLGRRRVFVYLMTYYTAAAVILLAHMGYGFQFFWSNFPYFNDAAPYVFWIIMINSLSALTRDFLETKKHFPRLHIWLKRLTILFWILLIYIFFYPHTPDRYRPFIITFVYFLQLSYVVTIVGTTYMAYRKSRSREHLLFMLAFMSLLLTMALYFIQHMGFIDTTIIGNHLFFWGYVFDILILMYVFSNRLVTIFKENNLLESNLRQLKLEAAGALIEGQQSERKRWSSELHDGASLRLATAKMRLSQLLENDSKNEKAIRSLLDDIGDISESLRNFTHELHPIDLEEQSFAEAVEDLIYKAEKKFPELEVNFESEKFEVNNFSKDKLQLLFELIRLGIEYLLPTFSQETATNIQILSGEKFISIKFIGSRNPNFEELTELKKFRKNTNAILDLLNGQFDKTTDKKHIIFKINIPNP